MHNKVRFATVAGVVLVSIATAPLFPAHGESIDELKALIHELDQKVRILERKGEIEKEATDAKAKETPRVTVGNNGLSVSSADTNFVFQLHGLVQLDNRDTTCLGKSDVPGAREMNQPRRHGLR